MKLWAIKNEVLRGNIMITEYIKPRLYAMSPDQLTDFVRNRAQVGDIATTYDSATDRKYIYFCTEKNIGKDIDPFWMVVDEKWILKNMFENITLEEKVDFLINKYIQDNT